MIRTHELSHHYAGAPVPALQSVTVNVAAGSCVGLLGPNGAGKTTLMSLMCGLQAVQSGEVLINGVPMGQLSRQQRQQIGLVPQDFAFYPQLSVWDNLRFFASLYRIRGSERLQQLLAETGLEAYRRRPAGQLSGGLKRRLNFAIGLINRPQLVFLDEITVGIDPQSRQFILDSVAALTRQGVTVVYTSHYLQEIEQLCSHLVLLSGGRVCYQGGLQAVLRQQAPFLRFQTEPMLPESELAALGAQLLPDGMAQMPADGVDAAALYARLQQQGRQVVRFWQGHASLEAFYLDFLRWEAA